MGEVTRPTFDSTARCLHVDPQEVTHEGFLQVGVHVWVVHDPHELLYRHDCLTHGLNEPVLTLKTESQDNSSFI